MKSGSKKIVGCVVMILAAAAGIANAGDQWLHVRVQESGNRGDAVSVNIPLQMIEAVLPMIEAEGLDHGRIDFGHGELHGIDLRELLEALQDAPDADFVTVKSDDEVVRVAKEDGFLLVRVEERDENVRIRMPLGVVEAALGNGNGRLDLVAALRRLGEYDGGDLITVESDDGDAVRIWIDSNAAGD